MTLHQGLSKDEKYSEYCYAYGKLMMKLKKRDFSVLDRMLYELSLCNISLSANV